MREADVGRNTNETNVSVSLQLDADETVVQINTGIGFLDHMLHLMGSHGLLGLQIACKGDLHIDAHHSVEDIGITLGQAFKKALGNRTGIRRYGDAFVPMDESLAHVSLDLSNRPYLVINMPETAAMVGALDTELLKEFFHAFAVNAGLTLHINVAYGTNTHHMIEAIFKALGKALNIAVSIDNRINGVPSTKGVL